MFYKTVKKESNDSNRWLICSLNEWKDRRKEEKGREMRRDERYTTEEWNTEGTKRKADTNKKFQRRRMQGKQESMNYFFPSSLLLLTTASIADVSVSWITYTWICVIDLEATCIHWTWQWIGTVWQSWKTNWCSLRFLVDNNHFILFFIPLDNVYSHRTHFSRLQDAKRMRLTRP